MKIILAIKTNDFFILDSNHIEIFLFEFIPCDSDLTPVCWYFASSDSLWIRFPVRWKWTASWSTCACLWKELSAKLNRTILWGALKRVRIECCVRFFDFRNLKITDFNPELEDYLRSKFSYVPLLVQLLTIEVDLAV